MTDPGLKPGGELWRPSRLPQDQGALIGKTVRLNYTTSYSTAQKVVVLLRSQSTQRFNSKTLPARHSLWFIFAVDSECNQAAASPARRLVGIGVLLGRV